MGSGPVLYGQSGSGSPQTDFNMQLNAYAPVNPDGSGGNAWETVGTWLLSDGTAKGDFTTWNYPSDNYCYPGMFTPQHPNLPNIPNTPGQQWFGDYNMELYFWTGNYNTYAAAKAAAVAHTPGVYAADSGVFDQEVEGPPGVPMDLTNVPATILTQNPVTLIPGDANGDGKVDINDLTIVLAHYNQTLAPGSWAQGDFTGDGKIDINDLTIVLANYNHTAGASSVAAVPEPAGVVLLACCGLAALLAVVVRRRVTCGGGGTP
jgi:hypothetical protein